MSREAESREALGRAVKIVGSQAALAHAIGVKQAHVWKWLNDTKKGVPAEYVLPIEALTIDRETGVPRVTRHELRLDIYPLESAAEQAMRERREQERRTGADRRGESREETV